MHPLCKILNTPAMSICLVKQNDGTWVEKHQRFFNVYKRFFFIFVTFFTFLTFFFVFFFWNVFLHLWFHKVSEVDETFLDCKITKPRTASRSVYRPAAAATAGDTAEDYYRINVFYPAVHSILRDLELRFGPKQKISMNI